MKDAMFKNSTVKQSSKDVIQPEFPQSITKRTFIKNLTKETIGNETSQAIIRIFDTEHLALKLFWLICLLGCVSLCGYLVAQTFIIYLSCLVYTTTTLVNEVK